MSELLGILDIFIFGDFPTFPFLLGDVKKLDIYQPLICWEFLSIQFVFALQSPPFHAVPAGCAVYGWMTDAYPKYGDADFNGGNQLVGTDGKVTIRVQAPSTYFVTNWISVPHVYLRVCSNVAWWQWLEHGWGGGLG